VKKYGLHAFLFLATCASCWVSGGPIFAATLMTILVSHEMGHYIVARRHGIDVSLPYFIPLPYLSWGTLGAVIRMREPITRRDALIDVGAAGPIAGLVVALPLLVIGLWGSPVTVAPTGGAGMTEGNSILYLILKYLVHGRILPGGGEDVQLSEMAFAAWLGILLTFINLLPIGQLDGGHIAAAFFGDRQEKLASLLHRGLPVVATGVFAWLFLDARAAGRSVSEAAGYGVQSALPWLVWSVLLLVMRRAAGGRYHPPVGETPLSPGRRRFFAFMIVVLILVFTPVPMRETLP
jgi:membrane-associated protease RseP (regulator of RpoE activity)